MNAETVESKLKSGELIQVNADKLKVRSVAYSGYRLICDKDEIFVGFVTCTTCKKVIKHDIHLSGTTHLSRHAASHSRAKSGLDGKLTPVLPQPKMTGFVSRTKVLTATDTTVLRRSMAFFCAADVRPFSAVEGLGFQHLAQTLINIGSKYGNVPVKDILPSRTTVAETCRNDAEMARAKLVPTINAYVKRFGIIGVTTDMWQEDYKKKNFVAVTIHMLDNGSMVSRVLQVYQFPLETQKSADNIRNSLAKMGECLGIKDMAVHFYFVTDQGSNIKAALSGNYQRLPCACHCLSTALKHSLPGGPGDQGDTDELHSLQVAVDDVKALVRYVKKSGLNASLAKSVIQENDTRWNSMLMMLESVVGQEKELKAALEKHCESHRVENIDFTLLSAFTSFLQPLKEATKKLEGDRQPTIQHVVLQRERLLKHMKPQPFDSPLISQLKSRLRDSLQVKFVITNLHKLALFLHPEYKSLRKLSADERTAVHSLAREYMTLIHDMDVASATVTSSGDDIQDPSSTESR
jgi:hypothetical protein